MSRVLSLPHYSPIHLHRRHGLLVVLVIKNHANTSTMRLSKMYCMEHKHESREKHTKIWPQYQIYVIWLKTYSIANTTRFHNITSHNITRLPLVYRPYATCYIYSTYLTNQLKAIMYLYSTLLITLLTVFWRSPNLIKEGRTRALITLRHAQWMAINVNAS